MCSKVMFLGKLYAPINQIAFDHIEIIVYFNIISNILQRLSY